MNLYKTIASAFTLGRRKHRKYCRTSSAAYLFAVKGLGKGKERNKERKVVISHTFLFSLLLPLVKAMWTSTPFMINKKLKPLNSVNTT